jgi:endonuclease/exonuclease/phosphatase family metal-dependent hydrolase
MQLKTSIPALWATVTTAASIPYVRTSPTRRQEPDNAVKDIWFPFQEVTLKNARIAEQYEASVAGLVVGPGNDTTAFEKVLGEDWVEISPEGVISGVPIDGGEGVTEVTVRATSDSTSTAMLNVAITVRKSDEKLLDQVAVMSYNLWQGGANVNNYHEKQLRFILESGADIIGLQESVDGGHATHLAGALGWDVWASDKSASILSRYPIVEQYTPTSDGGGVRINLNGNGEETTEVNFWNAHLTAYPYGPYAFCHDNNSPEEVLDIEAESGRTGQMTELLKVMEAQIASSDEVPVLLTGDMNAPSHLDYVEGLREKNYGIASFDWPTSVLPQRAGLIDSYRVAHPDPVAVNGTTWSPIYPFSDGATGDPEPQDRIDFVYATKQLEVNSSETVLVGKPQPPPNENDNKWTSDHAAVLTWFELS